MELLLERPLPPRAALVQMRSSNPLRAGEELSSAGGAGAASGAPRRTCGKWSCRNRPMDFFERFGSVPLPPYISRAPDAHDRERYQSLFARVPGCRGGAHGEPAL